MRTINLKLKSKMVPLDEKKDKTHNRYNQSLVHSPATFSMKGDISISFHYAPASQESRSAWSSDPDLSCWEVTGI